MRWASQTTQWWFSTLLWGAWRPKPSRGLVRCLCALRNYPDENHPTSYCFGIAIYIWNVTPRRSGTGDPQYGLHKKTTVPASATGVAFLAKTMWLHQSLLRIADHKSVAQHTNLPFRESESEFRLNVNPESQQALITFVTKYMLNLRIVNNC